MVISETPAPRMTSVPLGSRVACSPPRGQKEGDARARALGSVRAVLGRAARPARKLSSDGVKRDAHSCSATGPQRDVRQSPYTKTARGDEFAQPQCQDGLQGTNSSNRALRWPKAAGAEKYAPSIVRWFARYCQLIRCVCSEPVAGTARGVERPCVPSQSHLPGAETAAACTQRTAELNCMRGEDEQVKAPVATAFSTSEQAGKRAYACTHATPSVSGSLPASPRHFAKGEACRRHRHSVRRRRERTRRRALGDAAGQVAVLHDHLLRRLHRRISLLLRRSLSERATHTPPLRRVVRRAEREASACE
eukprot:6196091-Pleurochrysis_carterae.AAC.2